MSTNLEAFIAEQIKGRPIEAKIVRKVVKALNKAHDPITSIWDGEEHTPVEAGNLDAINMVVFNLDEAFAETASGGWVRFVFGNQWDLICDYTLNLEDALAPVNEWIDRHN